MVELNEIYDLRGNDVWGGCDCNGLKMGDFGAIKFTMKI